MSPPFVSEGQHEVLTGPAPGGRRDTLRVAVIGLASTVLYVAVYVTQRAMFRNGLEQEVGGGLVRGEPPSFSRLLLQSGGYDAATLLLFVFYAWLLVLCRGGLLRQGRARALALLFPVLFNIGHLLGHPYQSIDALTYVAHGYLGNLPGGNPYASNAADVATTDFAHQLAPLGWLPVHGPSPYGALWTYLEISAFRVTGDVTSALLLIKTVVVTSSLGSAAIIWQILGRVRPEDRLLGTLIYLWNPVIIIEFAAEGHNDALMILCVLASLALCVSSRPALTVVASLLGVLVKYVPLIFLPAQVMYLWRTSRSRSHLALHLLLGLLVGIALAALLYERFWVGLRTFEGVRLQGEPFLSPAPSGVLYRCLALVYPPGEAAGLTLYLLAGAFVVFVLIAGWRARDAESLLEACASVALVYVLVVAAGYWSWYASMPLALMALRPGRVFLPAALVLTLCSRLVAPLSTLYTNDFLSADASRDIRMGVGVTVPLVALMLLYSWQRLRREAQPRE